VTRRRRALDVPLMGHEPGAGFSLIEMIVVISILAIVASVAVPVVGIVQNRERGDATADEMELLKEALESYFTDHGDFPKTLDALEEENYVSSAFSAGDAFTDAWGNGYSYAVKVHEATLASLGEDQVDSEKNLVLVVDGVPILRSKTRDDMDTIHTALGKYEKARGDDPALPALPGDWHDEDNPETSAVGILIAEGMLPNSKKYSADAWGEEYEYEGSPADYVTSTNLP